jgi:hypothetical protein
MAEKGIDLTKYGENLTAGLGAGTPPILATSNKDGHVDIGPKGSIYVYDKDHLAYLERTRGEHLKNLQTNPQVAVWYSNREASTPMVRFYGEAQLFESGDKREDIRNRTIPAEVQRDADNKGVGVLIRVDKIIERGTVYER